MALTKIIESHAALGRKFVGEMNIVLLMIFASVSLATVFLVIFLVAAKKGQFDEDESPAVRMLFENKVKQKKKQS